MSNTLPDLGMSHTFSQTDNTECLALCLDASETASLPFSGLDTRVCVSYIPSDGHHH
jgi:hypothetical protein